jgi:ribosome-binding factor A
MSLKDQKIEELLKHLAAEFLQRESNRQSLVTVTGIELYDKRSKANILITVFPEEKQKLPLILSAASAVIFENILKIMLAFSDYLQLISLLISAKKIASGLMK